MSQTEKYIKLGEKATSFFDPTTRWGIFGEQIKPIPSAFLKSPRLKRFVSGGGLVIVSKEEYKEYLASLEEKPVKKEVKKEEVKKEEPKELTDMTKKELYAYIENSGWDEEDIQKGKEISLKEELLNFITETEAQYEE